MSYQLSVQIVGAKELAEAFRKAPEITIGALSRAIRNTAYRVEGTAKRKAPIEFGNLRASITTKGPERVGNDVQAKVGTNLNYARYQEEGTGIYGPKKAMIRPKNAKMLAWKSGGKWHYARQVRGVKPVHYFRDAKDDARPYFADQMKGATQEIVQALAK